MGVVLQKIYIALMDLLENIPMALVLGSIMANCIALTALLSNMPMAIGPGT